MKKITSLILTGSLVITLLAFPLQNVSAGSKVNHSNAEMMNSVYTTNMSIATQEIADSHIVVENKKFIVINEERLKEKIGKEQLQEVLKQLQYTNKQLSEIDLSNAIVDEARSTVKVNGELSKHLMASLF